MAEEQKSADASGGGVKKLLRSLGLIVGVILVAGAGGVAAFFFVLKPMLQASATTPAEPDDTIPISAVEVSFDMNFVNLIMPDENMPTSTLLFSITLSCANQPTADIINAHKARFSDTIIKLHDGHTRADVMTDPRVLKESIQKQVVQESNRLLARLSPGEGKVPIKVLDALHTQFAVSDNI